jgi:hypothetical protein
MLPRTLAGLAALGGLLALATGACSSEGGPRDQNYGKDIGRAWQFPDGGSFDTRAPADRSPAASDAGAGASGDGRPEAGRAGDGAGDGAGSTPTEAGS